VSEVFTLLMTFERGRGEACFVRTEFLVGESSFSTRVYMSETLPMGVIMFLKGDSSTLVAGLGVWLFKV
jgi:hypothetical protein